MFSMMRSCIHVGCLPLCVCVCVCVHACVRVCELLRDGTYTSFEKVCSVLYTHVKFFRHVNSINYIAFCLNIFLNYHAG